MSTMTADMTETTDNEFKDIRLGLMPWLVVLTAALFFFYEFIQLNFFNAVGKPIGQTFGLSAGELGALSGMYFDSNVLFLFTAGPILDRFSPKKVILLTLLLCALGTIAFSYAPNYPIAMIARFLTGIGSAYCFLGCIRLAHHWFPPAHMALVSGLIVTMAFLGGFVAQTPMTLLVNAVGWREALLYDGILGLVIFALIFFIVRDYPTRYTIVQEKNEDNHLPLAQSYKRAFLKWQNWLAAFYTSLMNLPVFILGAIWGTAFLGAMDHLDKIQTSYVTQMIFIGSIIGCPLAGWISDKMGVRKPPMLVGGLCCLAIMLVVAYIPNLSLTTLILLFFGLGLISSAQVISYPTVVESNPDNITATAVSTISICCIGSAAICQPLFGSIMDFFAKHKVIGQHQIYDHASFQAAITILPITFVIAIVSAFLLKETYCKSYHGE